MRISVRAPFCSKHWKEMNQIDMLERNPKLLALLTNEPTLVQCCVSQCEEPPIHERYVTAIVVDYRESITGKVEAK